MLLVLNNKKNEKLYLTIVIFHLIYKGKKEYKTIIILLISKNNIDESSKIISK